jgi:hypothetical protein
MTSVSLLTFTVILKLIQNDSYVLSRNKIRMFVLRTFSYILTIHPNPQLDGALKMRSNL